MKPGLQPGHTGELTWVVDPTMTITLGGQPQATVFSTPSMILLLERAAREALRPFLETGEESVGAAIQVEHLAPALLGESVRGTARVSRIDGRRVEFDLQAWVGNRELGHGTHRRAVIQLPRLLENLANLAGRTPTPAPQTRPSALPAFETLRLGFDRQIATITLNRPEVRNAVNRRMTAELEQVVQWLNAHPDQVRVVIITGEDDAFCAGDDIKELALISPADARELSLRQAQLYLAFERLPQVVLAAVNGLALGGGCVLAYSCDLRLASHAAVFGMPEIKLGWPPGYGVAQLMALVGKARALELCLLGDPISPQQALEWGLVNELVPGSMLLRRAERWAAQLLERPAQALRETKHLIHADEGHLPKLAHRADTEAYLRCLELPDAREGIAAFLEKRPARFGARS
jgi:enoyl-CoA hydratase